MDAFAINTEALPPEHRGDASVAVARVTRRKFEDSLNYPPGLIAHARLVAMGGARTRESLAGTPLRDVQLSCDVMNSPPPA